MNNIDLNGQIITSKLNLNIDLDRNFKVIKINDRLSIIGNNIIMNEKELVKEIIEKTKKLDIISGIIEIKNDTEFIIMIYNIVNLKWDIIRNKFL